MPIPRRTLLAGAAGAFAVAGCAKGPAPGRPTSPPSPRLPESSTSAKPAEQALGPFGLKSPSTIRVAASSSPLGLSALTCAIDALRETYPEVLVRVESRVDVASGVDWEDPPDLIFNDGAFPLAAQANRLLMLTRLLESETADGTPLKRALYTGALEAGRVGAAQMAMQYSLIVHGLWFSETLFTENGWRPPRTWAEARAIAADAPGRYLLAWDPATAGDLLTLVLTSAIKQAGHDLRLALESLEPTSWHAPEIAAVLEELRGLITTGQIVETEGSSQGTWAIGEGPLFCAAGANVLRDTKAVRPATFQPTVVPAPTMTLASKLPANAVLSQAQESFIIPRRGKNVAGAQELLRTMFSQSVASQFIEENQIPTTLRGALPVDPPGSLDTQIRLLERAGTEVINWRFIDHYGLREKTSEVMTEFMRGNTTTTAVITQLQGLSDAARADTSLIPLTIE